MDFLGDGHGQIHDRLDAMPQIKVNDAIFLKTQALVESQRSRVVQRHADLDLWQVPRPHLIDQV
jgi:hypothetical protein